VTDFRNGNAAVRLFAPILSSEVNRLLANKKFRPKPQKLPPFFYFIEENLIPD
jgi:hypothetical protein